MSKLNHLDNAEKLLSENKRIINGGGRIEGLSLYPVVSVCVYLLIENSL